MNGYSFAAIVWDFVEMDDVEGVGAFVALASDSRLFAYTLAQGA